MCKICALLGKDIPTKDLASIGNLNNDLYKSGNLLSDDSNGTWFDRSLDVYGIEIVVATEVGGQSSVPDEWAKKIAQTIKLLIDPNGEGVSATDQQNLIKTLMGSEGTEHEGFQTGQRIAYGSGDSYSPNPLSDSGIKKYSGYEDWLDSTVQDDMVWYQNVDSLKTGDDDIVEVLEHLMHTIHLFGVRGAIQGSSEALKIISLIFLANL